MQNGPDMKEVKVRYESWAGALFEGFVKESAIEGRRGSLMSSTSPVTRKVVSNMSDAEIAADILTAVNENGKSLKTARETVRKMKLPQGDPDHEPFDRGMRTLNLLGPIIEIQGVDESDLPEPPKTVDRAIEFLHGNAEDTYDILKEAYGSLASLRGDPFSDEIDVEEVKKIAADRLDKLGLPALADCLEVRMEKKSQNEILSQVARILGTSQAGWPSAFEGAKNSLGVDLESAFDYAGAPFKIDAIMSGLTENEQNWVRESISGSGQDANSFVARENPHLAKRGRGFVKERAIILDSKADAMMQLERLISRKASQLVPEQAPVV